MPRAAPRRKQKEPDPIPPIPIDDNLMLLWQCMQYSNYTTIDFRSVGRAFEITRAEAHECFKDLRKAIEHAICQDYIEKSNDERARVGLSSSSVLRGPTTVAGSSSNTGPARAVPSNANPSGTGSGSSTAGPTNTHQPVSQPVRHSVQVGQIAAGNVPSGSIAANQSFNLSTPGHNTGPSGTAPVYTGQASGVARTVPAQLTQSFSQPRASSANPTGSPSTGLSNPGTANAEQTHGNGPVQATGQAQHNLSRAGDVLLDMTGLEFFLGRTGTDTDPKAPNMSFPRVGHFFASAGATRCSSTPVPTTEAGSSKAGESQAKPSASSQRSPGSTKKDKGKKRKRVSESEDEDTAQ